MHSELRNRTIWLTGASFGIGKQIAQRLLEKNNRLILTARTASALSELQTRYSGKVSILQADLSESGCEKKLEAALSAVTDRLDTVILNAGICEYVDVECMDMALIERVTQTNYLGFGRCVTAALPLLRQSGNRPHLVGVTSASAYTGLPRAQAYGSSKAAMRHFLQALRLDLAPLGVEVSIVYPGFVETRLTKANDFPMPFQISTEKAAGIILSGIEKRKQEITFPRRLNWPLRLCSMLPAPLWTRLGQRLVRTGQEPA